MKQLTTKDMKTEIEKTQDLHMEGFSTLVKIELIENDIEIKKQMQSVSSGLGVAVSDEYFDTLDTLKTDLKIKIQLYLKENELLRAQMEHKLQSI